MKTGIKIDFLKVGTVTEQIFAGDCTINSAVRTDMDMMLSSGIGYIPCFYVPLYGSDVPAKALVEEEWTSVQIIMECNSDYITAADVGIEKTIGCSWFMVCLHQKVFFPLFRIRGHDIFLDIVCK